MKDTFGNQGILGRANEQIEIFSYIIRKFSQLEIDYL